MFHFWTLRSFQLSLPSLSFVGLPLVVTVWSFLFFSTFPMIAYDRCFQTLCYNNPECWMVVVGDRELAHSSHHHPSLHATTARCFPSPPWYPLRSLWHPFKLLATPWGLQPTVWELLAYEIFCWVHFRTSPFSHLFQQFPVPKPSQRQISIIVFSAPVSCINFPMSQFFGKV